MMFRNKVATVMSALMLAGSVYASQEAICPELSTIQAEGLTGAEELAPNIFFSYHLSTYNTNANWGFVVAPIEAESSELALEVANKVLSTMTAPGIPQNAGNEANELYCLYSTGSPNLFAYAAPMDAMRSLSQLRRYIQR
jgi:hypothetical protein